jgi:hypothetical protein
MAMAAAGPAARAAAAAAGATPKRRPPSGGGGAPGGGGKKDAPGLPERGSWRQRSQENGKGSGGKRGGAGGSSFLRGDAGRARKMMIAEFIVCIVLLGLSPLAATKEDQMGPIRFMKRGSATCAMFIVLGLVSSMGKGAARAAAMFGALVTLVLLVDQRGAFGKLAKTLNETKDDQAKDAAFTDDGAGPDDSVASDENPGVAAT